jgi:hypothetical protein
MQFRSSWFMKSLLLSGASLVALPACSSSHQAPAGDVAERTGVVELNLLSQGTSGARYRLRHANFVVQGPTTTLIIIGDDNPDATVLTHRVPEGAYTIFLQEGWSLELLDADAGATVVAAELSSPNPTPFAVLANQFSKVPSVCR